MTSSALQVLEVAELSSVTGGRGRDWRTVGGFVAVGAGGAAVTGAAVGTGIGLAAGGVSIPLMAGVGALAGAVSGGYAGLLAGIQSTNY